MYFKKKIFDNYFNIFDLLILLIPFSIIAGNYIINLNLVFIIFLGIYKYNIEFVKTFKNIFYYLLLLFVFISVNLFFSDDINLSAIGIIGLLKNIIYAFILFLWLQNKKNNLKYFSFSIALAIIILSISVLLQFIYYEYNEIFYNRINGLFIDESVAGSYIVKLLAPSLIYFLIRDKNLKLAFILFILTFFAVLITGDRAPSILYFISFFIFLVLNKDLSLKYSYKNILVLISLILICFTLSSNFRNKVTYTFGQFGFTAVEKIFYNIQQNFFNEKNIPYNEHVKSENRKKENNFFETQWFKHYSKAFEIGKKNILIGSGIKSFRTSCQISKYNTKFDNEYNINYGCATHPHNIYIEIFSETGMIGLIIFIFLIFYLIFQTSKHTNFNIKALTLCYIFILFFPFQTTGSFFSTFNGIFYFICLSLVLHLNNYYKSIK